MSKMIIIDGNANDKDNVRAYMVKGEPGLSPVANVSKTGDTATISITDKSGTTTTTLTDGVSPEVTVSKQNHVATISITDAEGTTTATVSDGADLTDGAVPTGAVFNFDGVSADIPGGYEEAPKEVEAGVTNVDFNTLIDTQKYFFNSVPTGSNKPTTALESGLLEVFRHPTSNFVTQRYTNYSGSKIYVRGEYNNTWSSWKTITPS